MPEGTVFFANEPILRVTAPLPQAQLVETPADQPAALPDADRFQGGALGAGGAGKLLVDFGLRRAHGAEAGMLAARASYLAGFAGTATVLAGRCSAFRSSARWRIRSSRRTTTRAAAFEAFRACRGRTT